MFKKVFTKLKKNTAGFSLIELVVALGILVALSGVLIPSLITAANDARTDTDNAVMAQLATLHKAAAQEHDTYNYFSQTVDRLADGEKSIYFWYESDIDGVVTFKAMNLSYPPGSTTAQQEEINYWAGQFRTKVCDYVNGSIEMPVMESRSNKSNTYIVRISPTNRQYLVHAEGYWLPKEED